MNNYIVIILTALLALHTSASAKVVEFVEDYSAQQAPTSIVEIAERVADKMGFVQEYEIAIPTKAGIQINPLNKFIWSGINPISKKPIIVINQEWFLSLPSNEQEFLLARCFMMLTEKVGLPFQMLWYIFVILSVLTGLLCFWLLGTVAAVAARTWLRVLLAIVLAMAAELILLDRVEVKIREYLGVNHDNKVISIVIKKMDNKNAAIAALERFDAAIKQELKQGQLYWKSLENRFAQYAQHLKASL